MKEFELQEVVHMLEFAPRKRDDGCGDTRLLYSINVLIEFVEIMAG